MKILVTGGAGFIGSHLCEFLLSKGYNVVCVDNLLTGNRKNISHLQKLERFEFIQHDIISPLIVDEKIDQIYNLACPASPIHYQRNAIHTIKANTLGMINMLGLAKKHHARLLQASTSEIYGDPLEHPQKEDYRGNVSTIGPRACYDEGKRVSETLCFDYHRQHKVEIRIARIFNTYGPRMAQNDGRVISNFIISALHNKNLTVQGTGNQTRSFCYVSDLIEGLYRLMNTQDFSGPVNLGNPHEITVAAVAGKIIDLCRSRSKLDFLPLPEDDPRRRKPDITLAQAKLNWSPLVSLEEGLAKTVDYFRSELSLEKRLARPKSLHRANIG